MGKKRIEWNVGYLPSSPNRYLYGKKILDAEYKESLPISSFLFLYVQKNSFRDTLKNTFNNMLKKLIHSFSFLFFHIEVSGTSVRKCHGLEKWKAMFWDFIPVFN